MIKAILFDMDGLLVDTETIGIDIAIEVCDDLGINLTSEEQKGFIGVTDEKFYRELFKKREVDFEIKKVLKKHFRIYERSLKDKLKPFPGADTLPRELKSRRFKLALVSGSTKKQIKIILGSLKINKFFDIIVSCEDVKKSKPDPQGYIFAANKLNVEPHECVIIEDAETGIQSARNARMKVIGVVNNGGQDLFLADVIVKNLTDINIDEFY